MIFCPRCSAALEAEILQAPGLKVCPGCGHPIRVDVYPAIFREETGGTPGERIVMDDEASCFYHPTKRAEVACSECGRFLCGLCDLDLNGRHLCPACMAAGQEKGRIKDLQHHRFLYDTTALVMAIVPIFTIWFTLITAPISIFMSIKYWKYQGSVIKRTKIRYVFAILISLMQLTAWPIFIYGIFKA